jgi:hypothetical protein
MEHIKPLVGLGEGDGTPGDEDDSIDFIWGARIPMRDGVHLNATIYKPRTAQATPAIFSLTPYISDSYHERAYYFACHGYAFALVDSRGRGNSEGDFEPMVMEGVDGHDVVQWLAGQPWCDGSVAMWGGSYAGLNQWVTLKEQPAALKTIAPVAAAHAGIDFPALGNIFFSYALQWLTFVSGLTPNTNLFGESSFWMAKFRHLFLNHLPFSSFDRLIGNTSTCFQTWLAHPAYDDYWAAMVLSAEDYDRIEVPILTITGHYDGDQPGAMHYYRQHMASSSPSRDRHYLIIGPWNHAGTRTPAAEFGGLKLGEASLLDLNELHLAWYDWILKEGEKPEFLKKRVAYYVMGAEEWKYANSLAGISDETRRLYLNSANGRANDLFHSGVLQGSPPGQSEPDHYIYDPLDVRPAELETEEIEEYLTDQRYALNLFGAGLVYHSDPFAEETEVSGNVRLVTWLALDVPDTDFWVTLSEIQADGRSIQLTDTLLRARYRNSLSQEELLTPGEINRFEFDGFTFFSRRIAKHSRLRLVIRAPNSIHVQKNYNSGGQVAEESAADARTAHVTLYHDEAHPSYLELPIAND